jgi:PDZ domain-containing protein
MSSRARTATISVVALAALIGVAIALPVPYVKLAPGPTFNVIGDNDGQPFIRIEGTTTYPVSGNLDVTTVRESGGPRGGLTFVEAIGAWFSSADAVVPRELIYPDDVTREELRERQAALFSTSESDAVGAALTYLGIPVSTVVVAVGVVSDSPASEFFQPRDVIRSIDGEEVSVPRQVVEAVRGKPVGSAFTVDVTRQDEDVSFTVVSAPNPEDPSIPYIGVTAGTLFTPDFDIDFTLQNVGGPSAGLMFATGIVDKLTAEDLTAGGFVAGSGTIDPEGNVGPVGGIRQKLAGARSAGAELFVLPVGQCREAAGHVPDGLQVAAVTSLAEAVEAIRAWTAGRPVRECPEQD